MLSCVIHIGGIAQHLTDFDARPFHIALAILIPKARKLVADQALPVTSGVHIKYKANDFCLLLIDAKPAYCEAYPTITLNTANGCAAYTVMAAFYSQAYDQEDTGMFRYYQYADLSDEADFAAYVEQVQKAALYDTGVKAQYGEQLLTLSTCSYHTDDGRFVVVAKKQE